MANYRVLQPVQLGGKVVTSGVYEIEQRRADRLLRLQVIAPVEAAEVPPGSGTPDPVSDDTAIGALVGHDLADRLAAAGYLTLADLEVASDEELLAIDGVGQATLKRLRALVA
jgi:hypothetical protein